MFLHTLETREVLMGFPNNYHVPELHAKTSATVADDAGSAHEDRLLGAIVMMLLGLRHWAVILGVTDTSVGGFEAMTTDWKLATMHLAVVDLVAAVGLWQRVAWGNVVWIYAALAEVAMHTLFIGTFGSDTLIVVFHLVTLAVYLMLYMLERRVMAGPVRKKDVTS